MMAAVKKNESASDKRWRLEQIREQMAQFAQWFHPEPDEVENLVYQAHEWAKLAELGLSEEELASDRLYLVAGENSIFPPLIRFCKDELDGIAKYCESRRASGKGTLRDFDIQTIKELCQTSDLEEVEQFCVNLDHVDIAGVLARIMRTSYRALKNPVTLDVLSISDLRGDLLEVIASTYAKVNTIMREEAAKGIEQGVNQANTTLAAIGAVRKLSADDEDGLEAAAKELRDKHPEWSVSGIANELHKDEKFSALSISSIRQHPRVKKFKKAAKAKGSVKK